jgi:hypothetical protein
MTANTTTKEVSVICKESYGFCVKGKAYSATLFIYHDTKPNGKVRIHDLPRMTMHPSLFTDGDGQPTVWDKRFELV